MAFTNLLFKFWPVLIQEFLSEKDHLLFQSPPLHLEPWYYLHLLPTVQLWGQTFAPLEGKCTGFYLRGIRERWGSCGNSARWRLRWGHKARWRSSWLTPAWMYFTLAVQAASGSPSLAPSPLQEDLGSGARVRIGAVWGRKWPGPGRWGEDERERKICGVRGLLVAAPLPALWWAHRLISANGRRVFGFVAWLWSPKDFQHASRCLSSWNSLPLLKDESLHLHELLWFREEAWSHLSIRHFTRSN